MGDMFAEGVKFEWLHQVFAAIAIASKHTFIVLTKRPERMLEYFNVTNIESAVNRAAKELIEKCGTKEARWNLSRRQSAWAAIVPWPPPNLLTGISAGDQAHLEERLGWLAHVPGRHVISLEPLVEEVDMEGALRWAELSVEEVYLGGPTGPGAWPIHPGWVRKVRDQCKAAGVRFWLKSWGEWWPEMAGAIFNREYFKKRVQQHVFYRTVHSDGQVMWRVGRARAGRTLDGEVHDGE